MSDSNSMIFFGGVCFLFFRFFLQDILAVYYDIKRQIQLMTRNHYIKLLIHCVCDVGCFFLQFRGITDAYFSLTLSKLKSEINNLYMLQLKNETNYVDTIPLLIQNDHWKLFLQTCIQGRFFIRHPFIYLQTPIIWMICFFPKINSFK